MRFFSVLLILGLFLVPSSVFAAKKSGGKTPVERVYLESEVLFDPIEQTAADQDGVPISGTIRNFYPDGRLAWETQWVDGKLHGVTRGWYENRKLREETTWVNGKMHGPARWYDEEGRLRRETLYENDQDTAAPAPTPAEQGDAKDPPAAPDKAPE
jgi:hypothetical protein